MAEDLNGERLANEQDKALYDLFFQSFRFSQGNVALQKDIFRWLKVSGNLEGLNIPKDPPSFISNLIVPKKHTPMLENDMPIGANVMWLDLYEIANREDEKYDRDRDLKSIIILKSILIEMLHRDDLYQDKERPGRNKRNVRIPDSIDDPHTSFVRKFVLMSHPTGNGTFDSLHRELKDLLSSQENFSLNPINRLSRNWEKNHPGEKF